MLHGYSFHVQNFNHVKQMVVKKKIKHVKLTHNTTVMVYTNMD